ncbi:MAG: hypothetical protein PXY39_03075 [archaeon]|jgi:hypothetical protein|nr:hypothetical protein [archaeon]
MADYNSLGVAFVLVSGILGFAALVILIAGFGTSKEQTREST